MLIALVAQSAQFHPTAQQALVQCSLNILDPATATVRSAMSRKACLPPLEVFVYDDHRVLELCTAHGASDSQIRVFLMPRPDLETFGVQTFLAGTATRIALAVHFLVADGAH